MKWHRAYKTVINTLKNKDDLQFITIRQNISILFKMLLLFNSGCFCYDCFHSIFNQGDYSAKEDKLYLKQNVSNFFFKFMGGQENITTLVLIYGYIQHCCCYPLNMTFRNLHTRSSEKIVLGFLFRLQIT